jgi:hypothetical protein
MGERAIPIKNMKEKGEDKGRDMKYPYDPVLYPDKCTKYEEYYPQEMYEDDCICKDLVKHISLFPEKAGP